MNQRCLDRDVVHAFVHQGILYEDAVNHNAVFVGTDENGVPRHVQKRSTNPQSAYKGNLSGSIADYAFHYVGTSDCLYVFEAPIDLMAYISLHKQDWEQHSYVALCSTADCAALRMLKTYQQIRTVYLCLDHDSAGIEGAYRIADSIHALGDYTVWRKMPVHKDWDEDLKALHGKEAIPASEHPKLEAFRERCSELSSELSSEDFRSAPAWKKIADARGYLIDRTFERLRSEMDQVVSKADPRSVQKHLNTMVTVCLAFCQCRDSQTNHPFDLDRYLDTVQKAYKPHRDTSGSDEQTASLKRSLAILEKDFCGQETMSAKEVGEQKEKVCSFAMECLRLGAVIEREQAESPITLNLI